jgi:glycosyltransferase involved in cell wall biosynthesis
LSFLRYPALFKRSNRLYLKTMTGLACRRAAAVIAVSRFTAEEVVRLLGVPPERVHVIHHGVDPSFRPRPPEEIVRFREQMGLPARFVLHVGTLEPRKNLKTLIQAFARLNVPDLHLVLAGGKGWLYEAIFAEVARLGLQDRVHFPGYVPAETLGLWYNAAYIFAYISSYEGFGLPVLEALASGTPTLTSETTSLPEAAGDGALLVSPDSVEAVADGLQRLLEDQALRQDLRQRGLLHAARFKWEHTVEQTLALYRQVMRKT